MLAGVGPSLRSVGEIADCVAPDCPRGWAGEGVCPYALAADADSIFTTFGGRMHNVTLRKPTIEDCVGTQRLITDN
jgi:hypothetical protein